MQEEQSADLDRKMRSIQEENDNLQKQVLETNEEIQEKRRHVKEIEAKLNTTIKEKDSTEQVLQTKTVELQSRESEKGQLETSLATINVKVQEMQHQEKLTAGKVEECARYDRKKDLIISLASKWLKIFCYTALEEFFICWTYPTDSLTATGYLCSTSIFDKLAR